MVTSTEMWLTTAFVTGLACFASLIIYNLWLHPLRKVPGPKLYAITRIPWIRDWLSGNLHVSVQRMHEKYGTIVRVAPDEVSFISPSAWSDIYGQKGAKSLVRDRKWYANLTEGQNDIIVAPEADHSRFRRIFGATLGDKPLRENEGVIMTNIDLLVMRLKAHLHKSGHGPDVVKWYNWTTFDIIGNLIYGESFGCLENAEYHPWLKVVLQNIRLSSYGALMERYAFLKLFATVLLPRSLMEKRNMHVTVIRDKLSKHTDGKTSGKDIVSQLAENDAQLTQGELEANLGLLTMAGSETSATALSAASYYLCKNKETMHKLRQEIDSTFDREKDISYDAVKNLPYLAAVIKEALRLYPPTPVGLPRRVISDGGVIVCDQFIPKGMAVYVTQYSAYRSPSNFKSPDDFRPERWLGDPVFASDNLAVVQPFITGPYSCIGKSLAYMEISLVLVKMMWNFDWVLDSPAPRFEEEKVYALWQKSPMNLKLVERCM